MILEHALDLFGPWTVLAFILAMLNLGLCIYVAIAMWRDQRRCQQQIRPRKRGNSPLIYTR